MPLYMPVLSHGDLEIHLFVSHLVQVMTCCPFDIDPSREPTMTYLLIEAPTNFGAILNEDINIFFQKI